MTVVNNVKRRFRRSGIVIAFFAMCFLVGCGGIKLTTRAYPLGLHPEATQAVIDGIVDEEVMKHRGQYEQRSNVFISKVFSEENVIVVKTTPEGHRQIETSLQYLEKQTTASRED